MTNVWSQFRALLPAAPLQIAQISAVGTDGTVTVELPNGETFLARGTGSVSDWVFVQSGELRGEAPAISLGADLVV